MAKEENLGYRMLGKDLESEYKEQLFLVWSALGTIIRVLRTREMKVKSEKAISFKNLTQDASVHVLALGPL